MTNGDIIRNMSDEEIADLILVPSSYFYRKKCPRHNNCKGRSCKDAAIEWLKQEEVKE